MKHEIIVMSALIVLSGFIALEFGFTTAIAELMAGIVAGHFISIGGDTTIKTLADIGILTLMYVAGLEVDIDRLQKNFKPSLTIGTASFIFPFVCIYALSFYLLSLPYETSILSAIALSTTSMAIVYPILRQKGELDEVRVVPTFEASPWMRDKNSKGIKKNKEKEDRNRTACYCERHLSFCLLYRTVLC